MRYGKHLIILFMSVFSFNVQARIPTVAFKGVTQHFQEGKDVYSPTLGITALESGLINNLRFYGNFTAAYKNIINDNDHTTVRQREYISDKSDDPVWKIVYILFPSPAGNLSTETESPHNFGKHVTTPTPVALLLDYVHQLRTKGRYTSAKPEPINQPNFPKDPPQKELKIPAQLFINRNAFQAAVAEGIFAATTEQENFTGAKISLTPEQIRALVLSKQGKGRKDEEQRKIDPLNSLVDEIFANLTTNSETLATNLKANIKALLTTLKEAIAYEQGSLYPHYTTEQIILAFFCEKFNTQQDIWQLIKALSDLDSEHQLIRKSEFLDPHMADLFTREDLKYVNNTSDLDAIYLLANADIFDRVIPYKDGTQPISNGATYPYNRQNNTIVLDTTFPDCVEEVLRHICNLITYNSVQDIFDLTSIIKKESKNLYLNNLVDFYDYQVPLLANAGDINIRSRWNTVVGDLNAMDESEPRVAYNNGERKSYNMLPGFINMINAFRKILNLDIRNSNRHNKETLANLDLNNASLEDLQIWIEAYLELIFQTLNPHHSYELHTTNLTKHTIGIHNIDVGGEVSVKVKDEVTKKSLFSFTISFTSLHGQLINLKSLIPLFPQDYTQVISEKVKIIDEHTSQASLKLLLDQENWENKPLLYALYPTFIQDNEARIQRIQYLSQLKENLPFYKKPLFHLLDTLSWDDANILERVSPLLFILREKFPDIHSYILGFKSPAAMTLEELNRVLEYFPQIQILDLTDINSIQELSLSNLPQLAELNLYYSSVSKLSLENLPALKKLVANQVQELSLSNLPQLAELNLSHASVADIHLQNLLALKKLNLSQTQNLQELSLDNLPQLTEFDLSNSSLLKAYLENLLNLRKLIIPNNLQELYVNNIPHLKELDLYNDTVISVNLENLIALKNLIVQRNLQELYLSHLPHLTELDLSHTSLSSIHIESLDSLKSLNLSWTRKLQQLSLSNFPQLVELNLFASTVTKVHIANLPALEKLILAVTRNLQKLSLADLPHLTELKLTNSVIPRANIKGLEDLPANVNIIGK